MKTTRIFMALLLMAQFLSAQVSNDNRYNIQVRSTGYYFNYDNVSGTNYPTFLLDGAVDGNGSYTCLINSDGTGYATSAYWNADTGPNGTSRYTHSSRYRNLVVAVNETTAWTDLTYVAMDGVCGPRTEYNTSFFQCGFSPDIDKYRWCMYRNAKVGGYGPGQWYQDWTYAADANYGIRLERTWRYYNGEGQSRPLAFGTLTPGSYKTHFNYNKTAVSGASVHMGYRNNWSSAANSIFDDAADVTYSFTINELSTVTVSTNNGSTNYDSKIHIVKDLSGSSWEIVATNDAANTGTNKAALTRTLEAGNYFIIVEGNGNAKGQFLLSISTSSASMTAGNIEHPTPWIAKGCELTTEIGSAEDAISSFAPVTYDWSAFYSDDQGNDVINYMIDKGPTLDGDELGPIDFETQIVRYAKSEDISRVAEDTITIAAIDFDEDGYNGIIKGHVSGKGGVGDVAGVVVYAVATFTVHGNCEIYSDTTNSLGNYEISNLYYGYNGSDPNITNAAYNVFPVFGDHIFAEEDTLLVDNIQSSSRIKDEIDFEDITTFFIRGRVTQEDNNASPNTVCGVPGVKMYLNNGTSDLQLWETDADGYYSIAVQNIGEHTVRPELGNHEFDPPISTTLNVIEDINDIDFSDTSRRTISGSVKACGGFVFGQVHLLIEDTLGCFVFELDTQADGNFNIDVPSGVYNISITDQLVGSLEEGYRIEDISAFFNTPRVADVSAMDMNVEMVYRQKPIINVVGIPEQGICEALVMEQNNNYNLIIEITETNTGGCPMDTGTVIIADAVSGVGQITLAVSQGIVNYPLTVGDPNFAGDNTRILSITVRHLEDTTYQNTTNIYNIIVTGVKAREATFTTVSPEVPFIILRDPPGDASYSYLEESTSTELAMGFSTLLGGSVNVWRKARLGTTFEAGFLGISTETDVWGEVGSSTTVSASNTNSFEAKLSFSNGVRYETSRQDDKEIIGAGGDLYIGAAMSLRYAKADILEFDLDACSPLEKVELIMGDANMQTKFVYSDFNIRNSIIPSLEDLRDLETEPAQIAYYQNQIDVWNQTLALNQTLKDSALPNTDFPTNPDPSKGNISWSGGGSSQDYSATSVSSQSLTLEFNLEIENEVSAELGFEVAGSGASGGALVKMRMELGASVAGATLQSRTTGFVLQDNDILDRFETDIRKCPVYNTPIFDSKAAITSCPYEPGSSPIDGPILEALNPVVTNVAPDGNAGFNFRVTNLSQDEKTRSYYLDIIDSSNPHGAKINTPLPILYEDMLYDESRDRFISVSRDGADPSIFSYEGLRFILYPAECDDEGEFVTSEVSVSAYYNSTCSSVTMMEPQQDWITNIASDFKRRIHIKDYTEAELSTITVQYTKAGLDSWKTAVGPLTPTDLNDNGTNGTFVDWEIGNIDDGHYDLRLKLTCGNGTIYTPRVRGVIDRQEAIVLGIPRPIDDIYNPLLNDVISVDMTEEVNCSGATTTLTDLETGELLDVNMTCDMEGHIQVVPVQLLESRPASAYRVSISGLTDMANNPSADVNWVFIVGDYIYDPDCSPVMISNNNVNQDAISQSVYYSIQITSDGTVIGGSTIAYKAEESINLESGFTVNSGGTLEASIENCPE